MIGTKTLRSIGENIRIYRLCLHEFNYYRQNLQTLLFLPTYLIDFRPIDKLGNSSVTFFQQFAYNYLQCSKEGGTYIKRDFIGQFGNTMAFVLTFNGNHVS